MTRLFLDTNIVVDVLERREPFCHDAVRLFTMAYNKQVQLVVSPMTYSQPPSYSANMAQKEFVIFCRIFASFHVLLRLMNELLTIRWLRSSKILRMRCNITQQSNLRPM